MKTYSFASLILQLFYLFSRCMRRTAAYIFLVFLASLIFYGGAGVNFVSYCCGDCEEEGVEVLLESRCCEIHGHDHDHDREVMVDDRIGCPNMHGCGIERMDFDWNSANVYIPDLQPAVCDLFYLSAFNVSQRQISFINKYTSVMQTGPPVACPRTYLSLLTTLLI